MSEMTRWLFLFGLYQNSYILILHTRAHLSAMEKRKLRRMAVRFRTDALPGAV